MWRILFSGYVSYELCVSSMGVCCKRFPTEIATPAEQFKIERY
jgi:hypothetical protein